MQLVDPAKVQSIDPTTHAVTFKPDAAQLQGTKIIDTASIGDIDGDGRDDIVVGTNEEYREPLNVTGGIFSALGSIAGACNSRLYAVRSTGNAGPGSPFLAGFPAKIGQLGCEILPVVGDGIGGQPALADLDGDRKPEIGVLGTTGPGYLLRGDGSSFLGNGGDGRPRVLDANLGAGSDSHDTPSILSLSGGVFGSLTGGKPNFIAAAGGIGRQLDIQLSEDQTQSDDQLSAFDPSHRPASCPPSRGAWPTCPSSTRPRWPTWTATATRRRSRARRCTTFMRSPPPAPRRRDSRA